MTLPTEIVNCDITQASGIEFPASSSSIEFRLSSIDLDVPLNHVIPRNTLSFPLDGSGQATATLWPNDRGVAASFYYVFVALQGGVRIPIGTVFIEEGDGPFDLTDILVTGAVSSDPSLFSVPYRIGFPNGSASIPGITFASQSNTGIFRPATNVLGFSTGGAERLRIRPDGILQITSGMIGAGTEAGAGSNRVWIDRDLKFQAGTWTPELWDAPTGGNQASGYGLRAGRYVRIGNAVMVSGQISSGYSTAGMTLSNTPNIRGLPFPTTSTSLGYGTVRITQNDVGAGKVPITLPGAGALRIVNAISTSSTHDTGITVSELNNGTILFGATYHLT